MTKYDQILSYMTKFKTKLAIQYTKTLQPNFVTLPPFGFEFSPEN